MTGVSHRFEESSGQARNKVKVKMPERHWPELWASGIRQGLKYVLIIALKRLVNLATLPYYRMFQFYTYQPIILIAAYTSSPGKTYKVLYHLDRWRTRKLSELQFISIACAILAAATIGSFSWSAIVDAYWLAPAFWYSSLILSILGIMLAAQQTAVLQLLGKPPLIQQTINSDYAPEIADVRRFLPLILREVARSAESSSSRRAESAASWDGDSVVGEWRPRWKMVFVWQCPSMFMSYSVCFFLAGLTLFVCTPLIRGDTWNSASDVAVVYLATGATAGAVFMFATFWVYHYVDLDHEPGNIAEQETDAEMLREYDRLRY